MQLLLYKSTASTVQYCEAHGFSAVGWGGVGVGFYFRVLKIPQLEATERDICGVKKPSYAT